MHSAGKGLFIFFLVVILQLELSCCSNIATTNIISEEIRNVGRKNVIDNPVLRNLASGAFLRILSDLTGVTPLENIKCRVTISKDNAFQATRNLISVGEKGILNLWSGTQSRTIEGALSGALHLIGSEAMKKQVLAMGGSNNLAALSGGLVGGATQAIVLAPAGIVLTSLNVNKGKPGHENDTTISVTKRIVREKGIQGMFIGFIPIAARQSSNFGSRSLITEICRNNLKLSRFGMIGEIGSGVIGGIGSCWNTPIETVRVLMQKDLCEGVPLKTFSGYVNSQMEEGGVPALFRGVSPRSLQAIWQTVFMVVVPNILFS